MYQCVKKGQSLQPVRVMLCPKGTMTYLGASRWAHISLWCMEMSQDP